MTELAIWQPREVATAADIPNSQLDDWIMVADRVVGLAKVIANSPFVPDGLRGSVPATAAAILTGRELGIPPMTSLANIHVIHGKPGLSALVMRALILSQGHEWRNVETTNTRCVVEGRRRGETEWTRASFSKDDAALAKIQLGGYPLDKLYARASARLARQKFADVIAGMPYSIEELEDGIAPDESSDVGANDPGSNGTPPAVDKPRTAQRKQRTPSSPPAPAAPPVAVPAPSGAGGDLPPLPGEEDETERHQCPEALHDPDDGSINQCQLPGGHDGKHKAGVITWGAPEPVTPKQLTAIWTVLSEVFLFGKDERDDARKVCARVVNRDLASSKDMTKQEAATVLDTLAHWEAQAQREDEKPRAYLQMMIDATGGGTDA